ncbi:hypothetical protein CSUI_003319 [Cystoisospora suis]|uniref:Transmembrane protein n=1 Tax=Cystoisospora suis TaxID=483139 RepID=A0A2C6L315_9APIC|nr:hypothetical protein CSUI_003319 [Cystoisospora suis]
MSLLVKCVRRITAQWRSSPTLIPSRSARTGLHGRVLQLTCLVAVSSSLPCSPSVVPDAPRTSTMADLGDSYWHTENYYSQVSSGLTTEDPIEESVWEDNEGYGYFSVETPGREGAQQHSASAGTSFESAQTDDEEAQDTKLQITTPLPTRLRRPPLLGRKMSFGGSASKMRQRLVALLIALAISGVFVLQRRQRSAPSQERAEAIAMRVGGGVPSVLAVGALLVLSGVLFLFLREGIDEQAWDKLPAPWRPEGKAAGPSPSRIFAVKSIAAVAVLAAVVFRMIVVISVRHRADAAPDSYPSGKSTQVQTEARDGATAEKAGRDGELERESVDRTAADGEKSKGARGEKGDAGVTPADKDGGNRVPTREAERGQTSSPRIEPEPWGGNPAGGGATAAKLMSPAPQAMSTDRQPAGGLTSGSAHSVVSHRERDRSGAAKTPSATANEGTTVPGEAPGPERPAVPESKNNKLGNLLGRFSKKKL